MPVKMAKRTEQCWKFFHEVDRYKSFKFWPFNKSAKCNAKALAKAGFSWCGEADGSDTVICFVCGKLLDGWRANDIPWDEHLSHSPNCFYAKLRKKESQLTPSEIAKIKDIVKTNSIIARNGGNSGLSKKKKKSSSKSAYVSESENCDEVAKNTVLDMVLYNDTPTLLNSSLFKDELLYLRSIVDNVDSKYGALLKELENKSGPFVCANCNRGSDEDSETANSSASEIAEIRQLLLKTNKTVNKHTVALSNASSIVAEQVNEIVQPIKDRNTMIIDFVRMLNECISDLDNKVEFKDQLLNETVKNTQVEKARVDNELKKISESIHSMNMQIHKLSAYIIQHQRRINEIQREASKLNVSKGYEIETDDSIYNFMLDSDSSQSAPCNVSKSSKIDSDDSIYDFMAGLVSSRTVPTPSPHGAKKPNDDSARTIFCYIKKRGMNEYAMYREFEKFGRITRLFKKGKSSYAFITYGDKSEADRAVIKYDRDLFDCHIVNSKKQNVKIDKNTVKPNKTIENIDTIVCGRKNKDEVVNNLHVFKYFCKFGVIDKVFFISERKSAVIKFLNRESAKAAINSTHEEYICSWGDTSKLAGYGNKNPAQQRKRSSGNYKGSINKQSSVQHLSNTNNSKSAHQDSRPAFGKQKNMHRTINDGLFRIAGYNDQNCSEFQHDRLNAGNRVVFCRSKKWLSEGEIRGHFNKFGYIKQIRFVDNADYFFIHYSNEMEAKKASKYSHHVTPRGSHIDCFLSRTSGSENEEHDRGIFSRGRQFRQGRPRSFKNQ